MKVSIACDKGKPNLCLAANRDDEIIASSFSFYSMKETRSRLKRMIDLLAKRGTVITLKDFDISHLLARLRTALTDEMTRLSLVDSLYWKPTTPFERRVYFSALSIPLGETRMYGDIAKELSTSPRAVGQALARNPFSPIIPCHRVVGKHGLGGFSGSIGRGVQDKRRMLDFEKEVANAIKSKQVLKWR